MCIGALPTLSELAKWRTDMDKSCAMCGNPEETTRHIMVECPFAQQLWALSNIAWRWISPWHGGAAEWCLFVLQKLDRDSRQRFCMLAWKIWQHRCGKLMEGKEQN
ncbi:hypothetical protein Salat_0889800 [Sesamum alatum]|uniref:Reverse transcriptase zinc-binding domain-containing protein n=1 Tax=Sesamum alatum TaxID=300844 RepID=A0AAE1YJK9_9LAMI|nr:hypothetical protein Salat_0889800 [Sesamum alatum]